MDNIESLLGVIAVLQTANLIKLWLNGRTRKLESYIDLALQRLDDRQLKRAERQARTPSQQENEYLGTPWQNYFNKGD